MMASHREEKFEGTQEKEPEAEPDINCIAHQIQNIFEFFYDQMNFYPV